MNYEEALQEALTAVNAQAAQQQMAANIEAGNSAYGQLKDQAAVSRSLERSRLAQRMQDLGIGAPQSLTVQNNSMMAGQRDLGDIGRANQQYTDTQNAMINQANANAGAQAAGISAQMNAAQSAADLEDRMNEFDRYYRMYMAKKITSSQFKKKTGMDVRGWGKRDDTEHDLDPVYYKMLRDAVNNETQIFNDVNNRVRFDAIREAQRKALRDAVNNETRIFNDISSGRY